MNSFRKDLENLINKHSIENGSNTPDFMLADYLVGCLEAFDKVVVRRENWYGRAAEQVSENPPISSLTITGKVV